MPFKLQGQNFIFRYFGRLGTASVISLLTGNLPCTRNAVYMGNPYPEHWHPEDLHCIGHMNQIAQFKVGVRWQR